MARNGGKKNAEDIPASKHAAKGAAASTNALAASMMEGATTPNAENAGENTPTATSGSSKSPSQTPARPAVALPTTIGTNLIQSPTGTTVVLSREAPKLIFNVRGNPSEQPATIWEHLTNLTNSEWIEAISRISDNGVENVIA